MNHAEVWYGIAGGVAFWCGMSYYFARVSGWTLMADRYRAMLRPAGKTMRNQIWRIGEARESGVTTLVVAASGLYLRPLVIFRFAHPPLLIPWESITRVDLGQSFWGRPYYDLSVGGLSQIRVGEKAYKDIARYLRVPTPVAA